MANVRTLQRSFGGGELTPEMFGRIDDVKYQTGLALCRNFVVLPHGPATNRPGTKYVNEVKNSAKRTRLIPFSYSTTQTMVLEFGDQYVRFHTNGGTLLSGGVPYEVATPYLEADLFDLHYVQSADVLTIVHPNYAPRELRRLGATNWALTQIAFVPTIGTPSGVQGFVGVGTGTLNQVYNYVVTAISAEGQEESSASASSLSSRLQITAVTNAAAGVFTANAAHGFAVNDRVYISNINGMPSIPDGIYLINSVPATTTFTLKTVPGVVVNTTTAGTYGGGGAVIEAVESITQANPGVITVSAAHGYVAEDLVYVQGIGGMTQITDGVYVVNTVPSTTTLTLRTLGGTVVDTTSYSAFTSGGVVFRAGVKNNLLVTGNFNTISWSPVAGAIRYNVYKQSNGLYGYIGQTSGTSFKDDNINPDISITPPELDNPFSGANNYPGAVSYFEQRRCFGGTVNKPQNIWMTKSGTESNLAYSLPTRDDDAINFRVSAREANTIRHMVPLNNLVLLTSSSEWRITSVNSDAVTPTTISVRPQSYIGANNVQPAIINNTLIYAAARGGHVRELAYSWQASGYVTGDLCLRSPHLFDNFDIVDLAYGKAPYPVVWCISSSGKLLGLTYVPEQQVGSWHQHDTDGTFESCCIVAEGSEDVLYVVVKRTINGASKRYVERLASRFFVNQEDAYFVDCGATFNGANITSTTVTVTGGTDWVPGEELTITASSPIFTYPAQSDVNDAIIFTDADGIKYRLTIIRTNSVVQATAFVDKELPAAYRGTPNLAYDFARDTISGLTWLEGKTVSILADGAVHPRQVVTGGSITLERAVSKAQIGLPITADAKTLPWAAQIDAGFGQGRYKNVNKVWLRVNRSSGIFVGPDAENLVEAKQRTDEPYGTPPRLKSEEIALVITPRWSDAGQVFIRQSDPLPLTLISMTMEVALGA